ASKRGRSRAGSRFFESARVSALAEAAGDEELINRRGRRGGRESTKYEGRSSKGGPASTINAEHIPILRTSYYVLHITSSSLPAAMRCPCRRGFRRLRCRRLAGLRPFRRPCLCRRR